jgi:[ribosomal protein S18]-alanine N-acetyltransferase
MKLKHVDEVEAIEKTVYPSPWSKNAFLSEIKENTFASYFVALKDGRVIGYAGIWIILDEAHITNLAVHPDYQRLHIGSALLQQQICEALANGARRMTLEVRFSNISAQNLYAKFGFVPRGVRTRYYSDEDALIMWLDDLEQAGTKRVSQAQK